MDSQLKKIENLTKSDRYIDALARQLAGHQVLNTLITALVKRILKKIEEERHLAQSVQQELLKTSYEPRLGTPKLEAGVVTPATRTPPKTFLYKNCRCWRQRPTDRHNKRGWRN